MDNNPNPAETKDSLPANEIEQKETEKKPDVPSQDPLKSELDKIQNKGEGRTRKEKLLFKRKQIEQQLREEFPEDHDNEIDDMDDNEPLTVGRFKAMEKERAVKTALQMADDISDEVERELVKYHINNTIRSTGNPAEDLNLAKAIVNSKKNAQIAEEIARKSKAKDHPSGSSAPANRPQQEEELTPEELAFTRPPFNMSKAEVLKARKQ